MKFYTHVISLEINEETYYIRVSMNKVAFDVLNTFLSLHLLGLSYIFEDGLIN